MLIIGITGKAGAGKDTVSDYIVEQYMFNTIAFADTVKKTASEMFKIPLDDFYNRDKKEVLNKTWNMSPRKIIQLLGTECGRAIFGEDVWVKRAFVELEYYKNELGIIFSDVRFDNEADMIRSKGGFIINVVNDNVEEVEEHSSESGITPHTTDVLIYNNHDKESLYRGIDSIFDTIS